MVRHRHGTTLLELLLALVLITAAAGWALQAAGAAERSVGAERLRLDALHRAEVMLSELHALPCDSTSVARASTEPRWHLTGSRRSAGPVASSTVQLHTRRGDTVTTQRLAWCGP
jgi:type II secretory pathway component PulJ